MCQTGRCIASSLNLVLPWQVVSAGNPVHRASRQRTRASTPRTYLWRMASTNGTTPCTPVRPPVHPRHLVYNSFDGSDFG